MAYTFDNIFAADPNNPQTVAANAAITIFDPADASKAPITITDATGSPLSNPVVVNRNGFGPAFQHPTLDRVGWNGGGFSGYFTSYEGIKNEAVSARTAAQTASSTAAAAAVSDIASRIGAGEFKGAPGKDGLNGSNVLPTQEAITQALTTPGPTKTVLDTTYAPRPAAGRNPLTGYYHVDGYGADLTGVGDSRAAVQAAVNAAVADILATGAGRTVYLPEGILAFKTSSPTQPSTHQGAKIGVALPVNLPATLTIKGAGKKASVIQLSDNARGAFWIDKKADYNIFQNVVFEDFEVDNNGTVGRGQILIGSMPEWITAQTRLSFKNIRVSRVDCYNVPVDNTQTVTVKGFVILQGQHLGANEATQTFTKDILIEDCYMRDTQNGLQVYNSVSLGAQNHYYDNIVFRGCQHDAASTMPSATLTTTSFYICGAGFGDSFSILNCSSRFIGDDAIEVGAMQTGLIDNFKSYNAILVAILFRLTHKLKNPQAQRIVISNSDFDLGPDFSPAAIAGAGGRPINWITDTGTGADPNLNFGTFIIENCGHTVDGAVHSKLPRPQNQLGFEARGPVRRIEYKSCRVNYRNFVYDQTYRLYLNMFRANMAPVNMGTGTVNVGMAIFRDCEALMEGMSAPNGGDVQLSGITAGGDKGRVDVNNFRLSVINSPSGFSGIYVAMLGEAGIGSPNLVKLVNLSGYFYNSFQSTRRGVKIMPDAIFTRAVVSESDWRNWANGTAANDIDETAAATNAGKTTTYNNIASA